jgi:hypothetical protein
MFLSGDSAFLLSKNLIVYVRSELCQDAGNIRFI